MRTPLAKRQIAAQCAYSRRRKLVGQCNQQRRIAIAAGSVCEHDEANTGIGRTV